MLTSSARVCIAACLLIVGVNAHAASITFTDTSLGGGDYLFTYLARPGIGGFERKSPPTMTRLCSHA
jgi:hypothetical protein